MYKITKHQPLRTLTNQITYNQLVRKTKQVLDQTVFELNDEFTRKTLGFRLKQLYSKAAQKAITGFQININEYDPKNPHYLVVDIIISMPNMIEYVFINITNLNA